MSPCVSVPDSILHLIPPTYCDIFSHLPPPRLSISVKDIYIYSRLTTYYTHNLFSSSPPPHRMAYFSGLALALLLVATAVVYYVASALAATRRLRAFPGPRLASFSYLWMARTALSGRMWEIYYRDATLKYGDVVRIGPDELLTSDPALIRRLSATRQPQYRRSSWYDPNRLDPYEHSMFSLRDDAAHDRLKARTAAAYAGRENPALEAEVDAVLKELVSVIRERYINTGAAVAGSGSGSGSGTGGPKSLDLAVLSQYFTLDSITKVAFGQAFGFLEREEDVHSYLRGILDIAPVMQMCGEIPALARIVASPLVLSLAGPKLTDKKGVGKLMAYVFF